MILYQMPRPIWSLFKAALTLSAINADGLAGLLLLERSATFERLRRVQILRQWKAEFIQTVEQALGARQ